MTIIRLAEEDRIYYRTCTEPRPWVHASLQCGPPLLDRRSASLRPGRAHRAPRRRPGVAPPAARPHGGQRLGGARRGRDVRGPGQARLRRLRRAARPLAAAPPARRPAPLPRAGGPGRAQQGRAGGRGLEPGRRGRRGRRPPGRRHVLLRHALPRVLQQDERLPASAGPRPVARRRHARAERRSSPGAPGHRAAQRSHCHGQGLLPARVQQRAHAFSARSGDISEHASHAHG
mmetsp:Transcript_107513/g.314334  ORF Transcript_107513/g.314334 Transcript_107513/m.314334 type:complete len:232 (-) Transcript_107513:502-1197(-)